MHFVVVDFCWFGSIPSICLSMTKVTTLAVDISASDVTVAESDSSNRERGDEIAVACANYTTENNLVMSVDPICIDCNENFDLDEIPIVATELFPNHQVIIDLDVRNVTRNMSEQCDCPAYAIQRHRKSRCFSRKVAGPVCGAALFVGTILVGSTLLSTSSHTKVQRK
jgi:hypothetical protein